MKERQMDIVVRLRKHALPDPHDEREVLHAPLLREAADEIERLRTLCLAAYYELNCGEEGDVFNRTHYCPRCDSNVDRNGTLRGKLELALGLL